MKGQQSYFALNFNFTWIHAKKGRFCWAGMHVILWGTDLLDRDRAVQKCNETSFRGSQCKVKSPHEQSQMDLGHQAQLVAPFEPTVLFSSISFPSHHYFPIHSKVSKTGFRTWDVYTCEFKYTHVCVLLSSRRITNVMYVNIIHGYTSINTLYKIASH